LARTWSIEFSKIANRFEKDQLAIFVLPTRGAWLLLSVTERLKWASSYSDVDREDRETLDAIQAAVELTENGLMDYKTLDDVFSVLDRIATALESQENPDYEAQMAILNALVGSINPEIYLLLEVTKRLAQAMGADNLPTLPPPPQLPPGD
jgi:hypothetical protein